MDRTHFITRIAASRFAAPSVGLLALLAALGCVEIRREVDVTPGPVPEEIRGARWQSLPATYCIVPSDAGFVDTERFVELTAEAFDRWGVDVISEGQCDEAERGNERNEITWGSPEDADELPHEGVYRVGFTQQFFRPCPGGCEGGAESRIVEADILIEPSPPAELQSEDCLFSTLLHETGHFLGVPHLESPAVMAPASSECQQELTEADLEALADLYDDVPAAE